jgi:branched-chain amino acid aminotransferase
MDIKFIKSGKLKDKPVGKLGFGKYYTDYMFQMEWTTEKGWHNQTIKPYGPIELSPATMVLHYAQETFEGMKAYRNDDNEILLFRPEMNARRMNRSNQRMCMPEINEEDFLDAINKLVDIERDWVPKEPNTSLYIRPFVFATEAGVGVHAANSYLFMIILSPVGSYYASGLSPVKIYVEDEYVRAVKGGTGFAKCGGNYASSIIAKQKANSLGYEQVLWLDAQHRRYVEEVGTMNAMFVINNEIFTAPIEGTVLDGITRNSCIKLLESWGYKVNEKSVEINNLMKFAKDGSLTEAFGTGTAAVISPIGVLRYKEDVVTINNNTIGTVTEKLFTELSGIQWGKTEDKFNWTHIVEKH